MIKTTKNDRPDHTQNAFVVKAIFNQREPWICS